MECMHTLSLCALHKGCAAVTLLVLFAVQLPLLLLTGTAS